MTALASIIAVGQLASAQPYAGSGLELDAIIAVIIGGTRLAGGDGHVGRTALGVAFISILNSGLLNLGPDRCPLPAVQGRHAARRALGADPAAAPGRPSRCAAAASGAARRQPAVVA